MPQSIYAWVIVAAACGVLLYVAVADLRTYKIGNNMVVLLAALYFVFVMATGTWNEVPAHLLVAGLISLSC